MADTRTIIISGDPLARAGLATLLSTQPGCLVVAQIADDADLLQMLDVYQPDVALWDLGVTTSPGIDRFVQANTANMPTVVLLANETDAAQAWAAGAHGLILRNADASRIAGALSTVAQGLVVIDPVIASSLFPSRIVTSPPAEELTPREREVLSLMSQGHPNKEIARRLGISEHTVKFHVNAILGKLHAQSRTEAVVIATRSGLVML